MEKKVSIITPCYNGEAFLKRYLDSILNQTYKNIELIFINDGSNDKTESIFKTYEPKFKKQGMKTIYIYQENAGQAVAINQGLKIFSGDYLTWPDSDDELTPNSIELRVNFLEKHSEYAYVFGNSLKIEDMTSKIIEKTHLDKIRNREEVFDDLIFNRITWFPNGGYLVRREAIDKILPSKKIFETRYGQNWQIILPLAYYYEGGYIEDVVYKYYIRSNSHSRIKGKIDDEIKKHYGHMEILKEVLSPLNEYKKREKQILDTYYTRILHSAVELKAYDKIAEYYLKIREIRKTNFHEKRWYLESKSKIFRVLLFIPKKIRKMIYNVRYKK